MENQQPDSHSRSRDFFKAVRVNWRSRSAVTGGLLLLIILSAVLVWVASGPPKAFNGAAIFSIENGATLDEVARALKTGDYVRSEFFLKAVIFGVYSGTDSVTAGDYLFDRPMSVFRVARRIASGNYQLNTIKVTVPEGLNKFEIAKLLQEKFSDFDSVAFISMAAEGYLFPDTYFFRQNATPAEIIKAMTDNFEKKIGDYRDDIMKFGRTLEDTVIMASIIETEARQSETRKIIAGILWKRIDMGMPLQVDVSFKYVNGKTTPDLTLNDLEIDSPYNTYKYSGFPPTPIANPGIESMLAAISPISNNYLYFLSDKNGQMRYAATFDEHKRNKRIYLR